MYKEKLGIPDRHVLKLINSKNKVSKGRDSDIYEYEEKDENGSLVAKYTVRESMSIHRPTDNTVSFRKYDINGKEVESGTL